jgi:hypothetical protein
MKRFIMTVGLMAAMSSPFATAGEVVAGSDTTEFTGGTAALASEVNANFQALINAINDNDARISALEGVVGDGSTDGTYTFIEMAVELAANSGTGPTESYSEISTFSSSGSFNLDQSGSFTGTINENRSSLEASNNCDANGCVDAFNPSFGNTGSESLSGTWSETATTVTLDFTGDTVVLNKAGPRLLVFSEKDTVTGEGEPIYDWTNIVLLVKQ